MRRRTRFPAPVLLLAVTVWTVPVPEATAGTYDSGRTRPTGARRAGTSRPVPAGEAAAFRSDRAEGETAAAWFDLLYETIRVERLSPPVASRAIGYAGVALHEAVAPGSPGEASLSGQLNALPPVPGPDGRRKVHYPSVANAALADTLRGLLPSASPASRDAIDALEARLAADPGHPAPPPLVDRSVELGKEIAAAILAWAAGDGYATLNNCAYTPPSGEGLWSPTPPANAPPLQPCWGQMRPFVLHDGGECAPPPPPTFSTDAGSDFYAEANEVYLAMKPPTAERMAIAQFWADNAGQTGTPPGHWISITGQLVRERHLSLMEAARAYAGVGIAVADSFIACWNTKYVHNLLRPVTYIQANIDSTWTSPIATPPFPEYTSGHSVQSAAAATVLTALMGSAPFTDHTHDARGLDPRSFDSFEDAAAEAAISRLYGGIHYRSAIDRGMDQGRCIGGRILDRVTTSEDRHRRR